MIDYPINRGRTTKRPPEEVREGADFLREYGHSPTDPCDRNIPLPGILHDAWYVAHTREED